MEQPQAIGRALGFGGRLSFDTATLGGLDEQYEKLKNIDVSYYCLLIRSLNTNNRKILTIVLFPWHVEHFSRWMWI